MVIRILKGEEMKRFEINLDFDTFIMNKKPILSINDYSDSSDFTVENDEMVWFDAHLKMIEFEWLWVHVVIRILREKYEEGNYVRK